MGRMLAVVTVELVDESVSEDMNKVQREILEWFEENCFLIPWIKRVKNVVVKES
ncbi:hypothetical protein KEJ24_06135 [Candidatus Bathyarchaeota archaeon]|nr:hypothetical protein [Candidatus Bathyarchaeota archaeon]